MKDRKTENVHMGFDAKIQKILNRTIVVIPAYNEEESLPALLKDVAEHLPGASVTVIDDGSSDFTAAVAAAHGAVVLSMPHNYGVGPATQTGYRYAFEKGFDYALRIDGDGQHPPAEGIKLMEMMLSKPADLIIGTRYGNQSEYRGTVFRRFVLKFLAAFISAICRKRITDPTSGFWLLSRPLMKCFDLHYPSDYPEPEAIAFLRRQGFSMEEVPVSFHNRTAGTSSIRAWNAVNFAAKVFLAIFVDRLRRVDKNGSASHIRRKLRKQ